MRPQIIFLAPLFMTSVAFAQPEGEPPAEPAEPPAAQPAPAEPRPVPLAPVPEPVRALPPEPTRVEPPLAPVPSAGSRTHDGFYLRLATGFGAYSESLRSESSSEYGGTVKGQSTGFATLGELAMGGTIAPGFVLGGGAYTAQLIAGTFRVSDDSDGPPPPELDPEVRNFALVGPFIDWYPNPKTGFHFQAALGLATLSGVQIDTSAVDDDEPYHAIGGGLMLGVGYEWWIGEEWSMGVSARLLGGFLRGKDDSDVMWSHGAGTGPSPMFTVTYH